MATILVVDDDLGIRALLSEILSDEGHSVEVAESAAKARITAAVPVAAPQRRSSISRLRMRLALSSVMAWPRSSSTRTVLLSPSALTETR